MDRTFLSTAVSRLLVMLAVAALWPARPAGAQIHVTSGQMDWQAELTQGSLHIAGERAFGYDGGARGSFWLHTHCNAATDCVPGANGHLTGSFCCGEVSGTATLDGVTYQRVGSASTNHSLELSFDGDLVFPPMAPTATVTAPFTFRGVFRHGVNGGSFPVEREDLLGSGTATVFLVASTGFPGTWMFDHAVYSFSSLPPSWRAMDIGDVGQRGLVSFHDDVFTVSGAGDDIWGTADGFMSVTQKLSGNAGEIVARVVGEQPTDTFAKAGIFMGGLEPDSMRVILDVRPNGEIEFMVRSADGGEMTFLQGATVEFPVFLRLIRTGSEIAAYWSANTNIWPSLGSAVLSAPPPSGGLAVTSHERSELNTAVFDRVFVTSSDNQNLLRRSGFEDYAVPSLGAPGWVSDTFRQTPAASEMGHPHFGIKNGICRTDPDHDCGLYQDLTAPSTGSYVLTVYANADRPGGLVGVNVNDESAVSVEVQVWDANSYGTAYTLTFSAAAGDTIRVWMYSPSTDGYVVIDDAVLIREVS